MLTEALLLLVLITINGALALSEIAVVSSRRARLVQLSKGGNAGARRALALAAEPTRFLSSVQVGITAIGILSGAIGEAALAGPLEQRLAGVPTLAHYARPVSLGLVVLGITYVSLILGELAPKRLALTQPERIASIIAGPMQVLARIGGPIVYVLTVSTDTFLRLLGIRKVDQSAVTLEDIKLLIEQGTEQGVLEAAEHELVTNVLNLDERQVAGVLTPRSEVVYLDVQDSVQQNREKLRRTPHDVLPLCDGGLEHVLGFVRSRRVLEQVLAGREVDLPALVETALFIPETMTLMALLEAFKRANLSAALVVDEFGDVNGIVSLTDVLSAIVGDLPADRDEEPAIVRRDDGSWLLDGMLDLPTVIRTLGDDSIVGDDVPRHYHTLGGLAMASLQRVPRTGDVFERGRYRLEVVDMDGNRVDRMLVSPIDRPVAERPADE